MISRQKICFTLISLQTKTNNILLKNPGPLIIPPVTVAIYNIDRGINFFSDLEHMHT